MPHTIKRRKKTVLSFIIDILTFGIAIAAAIGIGLAGTTYLIAK